jgi:moderate conductance mechanosensitive channel
MTREQWLHMLVGKPLHVVLALLVGFTAHVVLRRLINRSTAAMSRVRPFGRRGDAVAESTRRLQRSTSLGQLLRSTAALVVWTTTLLIVLEMTGVNIAPLLASAGIVGVAVGFGAQSLVKDYFAGIVIVIEDQFGVGDEVDIDGVTGQVVEVGLRTTRLQAPDQSIVWVRNGDIARVRNRSQGPSAR